jgi:hypothetical protein
VIKALINGKVSYRGLACTITAENLPPELPVESGARVAVGDQPRREYYALIFGLFILIGGLAVGWVVYLVLTLAPPINPLNVACIILSGVFAFVSLIMGIFASLMEATETFRPTKHFAIPIEIGGPYIRLPRGGRFSTFRMASREIRVNVQVPGARCCGE